MPSTGTTQGSAPSGASLPPTCWGPWQSWVVRRTPVGSQGTEACFPHPHTHPSPRLPRGGKAEPPSVDGQAKGCTSAFRQIGLAHVIRLNVRQIFKFGDDTEESIFFSFSSKSEGLVNSPHPNLTWTQVRLPLRRAPLQVAAVPTSLHTLPTPRPQDSDHRLLRVRFFFSSVLSCLQQKGSLRFCLCFCFLVPHVLRRMGASLFLIEVKSIPLCFMTNQVEPASRTTLPPASPVPHLCSV